MLYVFGMPRKEKNPIVVGDKFSKLTTISIGDDRKYFLCLCDCGEKKLVRRDHLKSGKTTSCGCVRNVLASERAHVMHEANITHGMSGTRVHNIWFTMRQRCNNQKNPHYKFYGGRGIKICQRWGVFENFLADMGEPDTDMTIDRIDNNKGYEPTNCRWASRKEQMFNTSNNHYLEHNGIIKTVTEWALDLGVHRNTLNERIRSGWSVKNAIETPVLKRADRSKD